MLQQNEITHREVLQCFNRHAGGDWGEVDKEDWKENDLSVKHGYRILSAYILSNGERAWVITEADRSYTTMLLPREY